MSSSPVILPHENDVLFGRGTPINRHPGNLHLRSLVDTAIEEAPTASKPGRKKEKPRAIAERIISQIQTQQPPGRFLIETTGASSLSLTPQSTTNNIHPTVMGKVWIVVDHEKAVAKVMHRLREKKEEEGGNKMSAKKESKADCDPSLGQMKGASNITNPNLDTDCIDHEFLSFLDDADPISEADRDALDCSEKQQLTITLGSSLIDVFKSDERKEDSQDDAVFQQQRVGVDDDLEHDGLAKSRDWDLDALDFQQDEDATYDVKEHTLRQWIEQKDGQSPDNLKSGLQIALKLTEFILEADEEEQAGRGSAIPLDSITAENVLILASRQVEGKEEMIDFAWIRSSLDESPAVGDVSSRLFAMGSILFELFSGEKMPLMGNMLTSNATSVQHIDLAGDTECNDDNYRRPHKKSQQLATHMGDMVSNFMAVLEGKGLPWSIRNLMKNLMDCGKEECCGDDAYTSFAELKQDLKLMLENPSRFVEDIQVNITLPTSLDMCDKLYGRENEMAKLDTLYEQFINENTFKGVLISGVAGVGKSRLAMYTQELTNQCGGYFCASKFEQSQMNAEPLVVIGSLFIKLCDLYAAGASDKQLKMVEEELQTGLGSQAGLLAGVVPNLTKLMPSSVQEETSSNCIDTAVSARYLFGELLRVITSNSSRPITFLIDDIQFADSTSLFLIGNLLFSIKAGISVFIVFSHRNDEDSKNHAFITWLETLSMFNMASIELTNMSADSVNNLVSETIHVTPRITRSLSVVLYKKTRGNPLFLRQLLASLYGQGCIYIAFSQPRWAWDLDKIDQQPISSSVLVLLIKEMEQLHPNFQLGLGVLSCIGSCIRKDVLNILSNELDVDLIAILKQVSQKGFISSTDGGTMFRFTHDKIQQAAYELKSIDQRRQDHYRYGLSICSTFNESAENNGLFFTAVTQINYAGPDAVPDDPSQKSIIAGLNLKAGKLSIACADYNIAFAFFKHGISYLRGDCWSSQYKLSVDLYDAVTEVAFVLQKIDSVKFYAKELVDNARTLDDSLNCRSIAAFALRIEGSFQESVAAMLRLLSEIQEKPLREIGDNTLMADIDGMNLKLRQYTDDYICNINMQENQIKRTVILQQLFSNLILMMQYVKPALIGSASLRMVELAMSNGVSPIAPLAFAYYAQTLTAIGNNTEGCRLGKLALKLAGKRASLKYKPNVIAAVYSFILWYSEPLQAVADAHYSGYKVAQQVGDVLYAQYNLFINCQTNYLTGQNLCTIQSNVKDIVSGMVSQKQKDIVHGVIVYYHVVALRQGLHMLDAGRINDIPTEAETKNLNTRQLMLSNILKLERAFFFRQFGDDSLNFMNILDTVEKNKAVLTPTFAFGIFYEGLACFLRSFETGDPMSRAWIEKGQSVLARIRCWCDHSSWNWENKVLLLKAMEMHTLGNYAAAEPLYTGSIKSAHKHMFIHEEAIASELAGDFLHEHGRQSEAYALYMHSIKCLIKWDALGVAMRVESDIESKFGSGVRSNLERTVDVDDIMRHILDESTDELITKKRQVLEINC